MAATRFLSKAIVAMAAPTASVQTAPHLPTSDATRSANRRWPPPSETRIMRKSRTGKLSRADRRLFPRVEHGKATPPPAPSSPTHRIARG